MWHRPSAKTGQVARLDRMFCTSWPEKSQDAISHISPDAVRLVDVRYSVLYVLASRITRLCIPNQSLATPPTCWTISTSNISTSISTCIYGLRFCRNVRSGYCPTNGEEWHTTVPNEDFYAPQTSCRQLVLFLSTTRGRVADGCTKRRFWKTKPRVERVFSRDFARV